MKKLRSAPEEQNTSCPTDLEVSYDIPKLPAVLHAFEYRVLPLHTAVNLIKSPISRTIGYSPAVGLRLYYFQIPA